MSAPIKGIIHVHSEFSRDGLCSVADLADFARRTGFQFVCLTDHAEDLTAEDRKALRLECERHSDESFVMIPGLEFRCHGDIHILGLGATNDIRSDDGVVVATEIREMGGLAILAHPGRNGYQCPPDLFAVLDGIEIWNAAHDGRFLPPLASLRLVKAARDVNPSVLGLGGVDLHWVDGPPGVTVEFPAKALSILNLGTVLDRIRSGRFVVRGRYVALAANALPGWLPLLMFGSFRRDREATTAVGG